MRSWMQEAYFISHWKSSWGIRELFRLYWLLLSLTSYVLLHFEALLWYALLKLLHLSLHFLSCSLGIPAMHHALMCPSCIHRTGGLVAYRVILNHSQHLLPAIQHFREPLSFFWLLSVLEPPQLLIIPVLCLQPGTQLFDDLVRHRQLFLF